MYRRLVGWGAFWGIAVFLINALANQYYWYTTIFGFDKGVHFFGGVFVAVAGAAIMYETTKKLGSFEQLITLLLFVFVVGLFWEYYEYILQAYFKTVHLADIPDSIGDLIFDMLGGMFGAYFVILIKKRYNKRQ